MTPSMVGVAGDTPRPLLVTGASGFLGGALVHEALARGHRVTAAFRRDADASTRAVVDAAPSPRRVSVGDLSGPVDWAAALDGVETVMHLAARVHVMRDRSADPLGDFRRVNVDATVRLAEAAIRAGVRRMVFVSSIKALGESTVPGRPFDDSTVPAPVDPYGVSKLEAERALLAIAAAGRLEVTVLRPVLIYGPGVKGNLDRLMALVRAGVPLPLGAVDNRRSLLAVGNAVDALLTLEAHPAAAGRSFVIADGDDLSTPALIRRIGEAVGRPARLVPVPVGLLRVAGRFGGAGPLRRLVESLEVDASGLREAIGWRPPVTVEAGLAQMAAHRASR